MRASSSLWLGIFLGQDWTAISELLVPFLCSSGFDVGSCLGINMLLAFMRRFFRVNVWHRVRWFRLIVVIVVVVVVIRSSKCRLASFLRSHASLQAKAP